MKKTLLILVCLLAGATTYAQKLEVTAGAYTGLFKFSGKSTESVSFFNSSTGTTGGASSYTNNPYGNKIGIGYGISGQGQLVAKGGFIIGLQVGYEQLKSKIAITQVYVTNSTVIGAQYVQTLDATGSAALTSNIINVNPYLGYRIPLTKVKLDILAGVDLGFINNTREKGSARANNGTTYTTDLDRTTITEDFRLRIGLALSLNKFGLNASYANGVSNYKSGYIGGGAQNAHSKVIRIGIGYRIF